MPEWSITLHSSIQEIDPEIWNRCAGDDNPFICHAYLQCVEDSGSANAKTGWLPRHLCLRDADGEIQAVAPLYVKSHSWGEYVFDQGWARAFESAGGNYYPKLQVASPFSPVPGARLLVRPDTILLPQDVAKVVASALKQVCGELGLSSVHVTFCTQPEQDILVDDGWLARSGIQYHWHNNGYENFDGFLDALASRKRKSIKRERREANNAGLTFKTLRGAEITPPYWAAFYRFYCNTIDRKWGSAYLTESFFIMLGERLGDKVALMIAEHQGQPVAGALNLVGKDTLFGRNWGCDGEWPFLHFELCYYRAIDFAIEHGLKRVEAGAQGEHKIQRGYLPQQTFSAHWIAHNGLEAAVAEFLAQERRARLEDMAYLETLSPYRQDNHEGSH